MSLDPLRFSDLRAGPAGGPASPAAQRPTDRSNSVTPFSDVLRQAEQSQTSSLKFSAHAQTRLQSRQIPWGQPQMERLEGAVQRAAGKGAKESLVLLDQTALVVSVPNRTVITVCDQEQLKQNVFTNIDSAVFA
jgi:flagellar operon protein